MVYYLSFLRLCTSLYTALKKHSVLDSLSAFLLELAKKYYGAITHATRVFKNASNGHLLAVFLLVY